MTTPRFISPHDQLKMGVAAMKLPALFHCLGAGLAGVIALLLMRGICSAQTQNASVVAWGDDTYGQTNVPPGSTNVMSIATGGYSCLALNANGTVTAWGNNSFGQTTGPVGVSNVMAVAESAGFSMVLFSNGTVTAWGDDVSGETNVPIGLNHVVAISAGNAHALALKSNGTVTAWGWNGLGQASVPGNLNNVIAIAAGGLHSLALENNGQVVAWGDDASGQTDVPAGLTNAIAIAAGFEHSIALKSDGAVVAWGDNGFDQSIVPSGLSNVVQIAAGDYHSLAVKADGTVVVWGDETTVPVGLYNVKLIAGGTAQNLALVNGLPVIMQQPASQTVYSGGDVAFGVNVGAFGLSPVLYQWQFRGTDICGATNSLLTLSDVQPDNIGSYNVLVTDSYGTTISSNADLNVVQSLPIIVAQPQSQSSFLGAGVAFAVTTTGSLPMSYQWQLNGTDLVGETNQSLILNDLPINASGMYSVVITNSFGVTASSNALLSVSEIAAWGQGSSGQTNVAAGLTNVAAVAAGAFYGLALNNDGTLFAWGSMTIPGGLSNMVAIAGGAFHSLALRNDGTVFGWGDNSQWGNNSYGEVTIPPGLSNVVGIAAGAFHSLALKSDGTVVDWGGRSGFGPGPPPAGLNNVIAIAAGYYFALALKNDGTVVGWGITVPAGLSNVVAIAGSGSGGLALTANGNIIGMGATIPGGISNVVAIAGGGDQFLALENNGAITAFGGNLYGEGNVPSGLGNVVAIAGGEYFSLALLNNSSPFIVRQPLNVSLFSGLNTFFNAGVVGSQPTNCQWHFNGADIIGATNATLVLTNVQPANAGGYGMVASNSTGVATTSIAILNVVTSPPIIVSQPTNSITPVGQNVTFNVSVTGSMPVSYQWLYDGNVVAGATNASLNLNGIPWAAEGGYSVVISNQYGGVSSPTVALTMPRARVVAWGNDNYGQTNVPSTLTNVIGIAAGYENTLALKADGSVTGWGYNGWQETTPPAGLSNVMAVATGGESAYPFSLALKSNGTVAGWGNNTYNQANPPAGFSNLVSIAAGQAHGLALRNDGRVFAWGNNSSGQTNVPATLTNAIAIAAGNNACLALQNGGSLVAWGDNSYGQTNVPSGLTNVMAIASGWYHCLALKTDGTVTAWGYNNNYQTNVPSGLSNVVAIAAGQYHSLAVKNDGTVVAWGQNAYKQTNVPVGLNHVVAVAGGADHSLALIQDGPPVIFTQPVSQTNYAGFTALLGGISGGLQPMYFQWVFNGTNIGAATNSTLMLTNLQPGNTGIYSFNVSNALGLAVSSNIFLSILTNSPILTLQPTNQTIIAGSNITFSAAVGAGPIPSVYQWQFNGANLPGATNLLLILTNVQVTNSGVYAIVVSNNFGSIASSNALLTVIDLPTALNAPSLTWTTGGNAAWFPETAVSHDGVAAAQSGAVGYGLSSTLQTTVAGPGTLGFWWDISSVGSLSFSINGASQGGISYSTGWGPKTYYLPVGSQTLLWKYGGGSFAYGANAAWLDQVSFVPGGTAPIIIGAPATHYVRPNTSVGFLVSAVGTPPLYYQWQFNGVSLNNQTNANLSLLNVQPANAGIYSVVVTNTYGVNSTNAALFVPQFTLSTGPTNLVFSTNGFQLQLSGVLTTNPVVILGSTDLVNWLPLYTNAAMTGSFQFLDLTATNLPVRFYRSQE